MASCVTAWGRCNLRETLYKICSYDPEAKKLTKNKFFNNVMYMDTDSLYTTLTTEEIISIIPDKISNKLGSWSLESEYNKFKAIGQKKYIFNGRKINKEAELKTICKCAGLPEAARKEQTFGSFKIGSVIEGKKVKKKVTGGYALIYDTYTICNNIL
jgi:protein-disulfide isomerase-like protein with CxxC motif